MERERGAERCREHGGRERERERMSVHAATRCSSAAALLAFPVSFHAARGGQAGSVSSQPERAWGGRERGGEGERERDAESRDARYVNALSALR